MKFGLKELVKQVADERIEESGLGEQIAVANEVLATKGTFYNIGANGTISASSTKVTIGDKEYTLKVSDIIYKPSATPELWICVAVTSSATTNINIKLA
ncbi:MAG: hypothetical protein II063_10350 [Prevotella sp.]|nr:hypothetical protein [Prevotella sp.]